MDCLSLWSRRCTDKKTLKDKEDGVPVAPTLRGYRSTIIQSEEAEVSDDSSVDSEDMRKIQESRDALMKEKADRRRESDRKRGFRNSTSNLDLVGTGNSFVSGRDTVQEYAPITRDITLALSKTVEEEGLSAREEEASEPSPAAEGNATGSQMIDDEEWGEQKTSTYADVNARMIRLRSQSSMGSRSSFGTKKSLSSLAIADDVGGDRMNMSDLVIRADLVKKATLRITKKLQEEEQQNDTISQLEREELQRKIGLLQTDPNKLDDHQDTARTAIKT